MLKQLSTNGGRAFLDFTISQLLNTSQQTRWIRMRKPPWVPRAKSKAFYVPPLPQVDPAEEAYLKPIWYNYKTQMRSLYQLFATEIKFSAQESVKAKEEQRRLLEKEESLAKENERVNAMILVEQLKDEAARLEEKKKHVEIEYKKKLKLEQMYVDEANKQVVKLKQKAMSFVDQSNLEYEIEKALNERHDYNFALSSNGYLYKNHVLVSQAQAFDGKFIPKPKKSVAMGQAIQGGLEEIANKSDNLHDPKGDWVDPLAKTNKNNSNNKNGANV